MRLSHKDHETAPALKIPAGERRPAGAQRGSHEGACGALEAEARVGGVLGFARDPGDRIRGAWGDHPRPPWQSPRPPRGRVSRGEASESKASRMARWAPLGRVRAPPGERAPATFSAGAPANRRRRTIVGGGSRALRTMLRRADALASVSSRWVRSDSPTRSGRAARCTCFKTFSALFR